MQPDFKYLIRICDNIERAVHLIPNKAAVIAVNFSKERFVKRTGSTTESTRGARQRSVKVLL